MIDPPVSDFVFLNDLPPVNRFRKRLSHLLNSRSLLCVPSNFQWEVIFKRGLAAACAIARTRGTMLPRLPAIVNGARLSGAGATKTIVNLPPRSSVMSPHGKKKALSL